MVNALIQKIVIQLSLNTVDVQDRFISRQLLSTSYKPFVMTTFSSLPMLKPFRTHAPAMPRPVRPAARQAITCRAVSRRAVLGTCIVQKAIPNTLRHESSSKFCTTSADQDNLQAPSVAAGYARDDYSGTTGTCRGTWPTSKRSIRSL